MGEDRSPRRCRLDPLALFEDFGVCLVYGFAHFRERLPAPVAKLPDSLVDEGRASGPFQVLLIRFITALRPSEIPSNKPESATCLRNCSLIPPAVACAFTKD